MIIETLIDVAGAFFNLKDIHDLIKQERLQTIIACLEKMADVHIKTAIQELGDMRRSAQPENECNRAIGQIKLAANSLLASSERQPVLRRLMETETAERRRKKEMSLRLTGCYLMVAGLYHSQGNTQLAKESGAKAIKTFEEFAVIHQDDLRGKIAEQFIGSWANDQAGGTFVLPGKEAELAGLRHRFGLDSDQAVFRQLASIEMHKMWYQLFGWLERL